ncbi:MAG: hypothetical protein AABY22_03805 [Nanoarchaeota archaeon]
MTNIIKTNKLKETLVIKTIKNPPILLFSFKAFHRPTIKNIRIVDIYKIINAGVV